jgi:hypothetical protein
VRRALEGDAASLSSPRALRPGRGPVLWPVPAQGRTTAGSVIAPATAEAAATAGLER